MRRSLAKLFPLLALSFACSHPTTDIARSVERERAVAVPGAPDAGSVPRRAMGGREAEPAVAPTVGMSPLVVSGFDPAVVSFPSREAALSPVVFVAHGAGDHPVPQCHVWRYMLGDRGVVVCITGKRTDVRTEPRYFPDHRTLEKILVATLEAFRAAHPGIATPENTLYAGYSQGATMGAVVIHSHAADFPRVALVEGGYGRWTRARAVAFEQHGGRRVLFMCGTPPCAAQAPVSAKLFEAVKVETRIVQNLAAGHGYGPALVEPLKAAIPWLLSDAP